MAITTVRVAALTTCEVTRGGAELRLHMRDETGREVALELPAGLASSLILTLPHLMEKCLQQLRGDAAARLVFPLGCWMLESADDTGAFILSLQTPDGFKVAFAVPSDDARALAEALDAHCAPAPPGIPVSPVLK
jgi:hypothetical protein